MLAQNEEIQRLELLALSRTIEQHELSDETEDTSTTDVDENIEINENLVFSDSDSQSFDIDEDYSNFLDEQDEYLNDNPPFDGGSS